ncbi:helix-turn-helix transcriptional regulator [Intestinibacter sp.]|uniref:helix-turn-helix transcriptional regulator n=1 Tax=Intestinibacter sp. TaxID=1965304 RepID=UPI002A75739B|nr:helix-turn-helix transcriptional regulator [Intestinibacter sp.]MDY2734711.1 helix-turn-helix transcriptional regulator [Intestinibacter sp.]
MDVNLLKSLRVRQGLKQKDVADILGIEANSYSCKENGKRKFTVEEAIKLSQLFKCKIEDIFLN